MIERLRVFLGTLLLVAAAAGFVIVPEHKPVDTFPHPTVGDIEGALSSPSAPVTWHLSTTLYDVLRVTTWALLIIGVVVLLAAYRTTRAPGTMARGSSTNL